MELPSILAVLGQCLHGIGLSDGLMISLFSAGLVGGFTHCSGMCGAFVLSQTKDIQKTSQALLLPYHLGRMTTYVAMAVVFSSILNMAFLFLPVRAFIVAPILMSAGVIFLVQAFPRLGRVFPWLSRVNVGVPFSAIQKGVSALMQETRALPRYGLGVLLGFMPCGLIVSAVMAAATAPDVFQAVLAMSAFAVGTMPALIMVALGGKALRVKYPNAAGVMQKVAMTWSGIWLFVMAGFVLISQS